MNKILRRATSTHTFSMPYLEGDISKVVVDYMQNGKLIIRRLWRGEDRDTITVNDKVIIVNLDEKESARFMPLSTVKIQIQVFGVSGEVVKSNLMTAVTDQ